MESLGLTAAQPTPMPPRSLADTPPVTILGSGMAGLGAAHRLRELDVASVIYERADYPGGHTASFAREGFVFDDGPHISFTRNERLQALLAEAVDGRFEVIQTRVDNHWKGHWIKHPAQCNLHGLPADLVVAVLEGFIAAHHAEPGEIRHYEDWLVASYGRTFAETFPMEYGAKYHTCRARDMTTDWLGPRLYRPALAEVLRGAISPQTPDVHYVSHFRYPSHGGFAAYLRPFVAGSDIRLEHEVVGIDPRERTLTFAHGDLRPYRRLVSSVPLPALVPMIAGAPPDVVAAAARLACTTCVVVNVGVDRADLSNAHWTYFYDRDYVFTRLSFPHMLSPHTVPEGCGAIQAECYYSAKYRPLDRPPESLVEPVIADLRRCGLLRDDDAVRVAFARLVPWANVIFDRDRPAALAAVHGYLAEVGIHPCGRYGEWGYQWTDEAWISGETAAEAALEKG